MSSLSRNYVCATDKQFLLNRLPNCLFVFFVLFIVQVLMQIFFMFGSGDFTKKDRNMSFHQISLNLLKRDLIIVQCVVCYLVDFLEEALIHYLSLVRMVGKPVGDIAQFLCHNHF